MKAQLIRGDITVGKSSIHGYGVFANQRFQPGDIIEECYCLIYKHNENALVNYVYKANELYLLPLGYGAIINHSQAENANPLFDAEHSVLRFIATKDIQPGAEIFTNYGGAHWFEERGLVEHVSFRARLARLMKNWVFVGRFALCVGIVTSVIAVIRMLARG